MISSSNRAAKRHHKTFSEYRPLQIHKPAFVLKLYSVPGLEGPVFGVVAGSKVSKRATDRNLIKRRLRHLLGEYSSFFKINNAVIIIAKPGSITTTFVRLREEFVSSLSEAKIL